MRVHQLVAIHVTLVCSSGTDDYAITNRLAVGTVAGRGVCKSWNYSLLQSTQQSQRCWCAMSSAVCPAGSPGIHPDPHLLMTRVYASSDAAARPSSARLPATPATAWHHSWPSSAWGSGSAAAACLHSQQFPPPCYTACESKTCAEVYTPAHMRVRVCMHVCVCLLPASICLPAPARARPGGLGQPSQAACHVKLAEEKQ